jgi:hypothetical protein
VTFLVLLWGMFCVLQYAEARRIISKNFSGSACDIPTAKFMQLVVEEVLKTHRV